MKGIIKFMVNPHHSSKSPIRIFDTEKEAINYRIKLLAEDIYSTHTEIVCKLTTDSFELGKKK